MGREDSPARRRDRSREKGRARSRDRDDRRSHGDRKKKRDKRSRRDRSDSRSRSRSRSSSRSRSRGRGEREREPKRRRQSSLPPLPDVESARQAAAAGHDAEQARQAEREREQRALEEEMEKRRRRVQAWQAQRRKLGDKEEEAQEDGGEEEGPAREWNLEDEDGLSDEEVEGGAAETNGIAASGDGEAAAAAAAEAPTAAAQPTPLPKKPREEEEEEEDPLEAFMQTNARQLAKPKVAMAPPSLPPPLATAAAAGATTAAAMEEEDDEIDPLDAFMAANVLPEVQQLAAAEAVPAAAAAGAAGESAPLANGRQKQQQRRRKARRRRPGYAGSSSEDEAQSGGEGEGGGGGGGASDEEDDAEWARKVQAGKLSKADRLAAVDHSTIDYPPFRRNFYIEVPELAKMSPQEVEAYRRSLDGIKVRGKEVPKPVKNWNQCGLSARVLEVIRRAGFDRPLPIQAQALPVIMGGRDCIGIAKTGSGKTVAFVLPLIRHVKDQRPLAQGDGPIGLIMAPTRELVTQIGKEVRRFAHAAGMECCCVYGGSGVANQISELKWGAEVVVCTPGRMIDILATGSGKITNLRRVTYLVLDEADRMFDMGFEPQIMRMINSVRPDRQTVLFSATFPRTVEALARQVLVNPVEIQVGGRSVVNPDITQFVELRAEGERFLRLLELLGEWYERGKVLVFVSSQDRCDSLFRDLLRAGYPCLSLHGGKDQSDRESTVSDFKSAVCNVLVATSVAARGLDVKDLMLVVNYDCPNHHEDYVHRVGRTGRAGAKGTAVTFISPDEEQYAPDLVKALRESGAPIPADVAALAEGFDRKRKAGLAKAHGSGFGGSGFKFDAAEDEQVKALKKAAAKEFGIVEASDSEDEEEGDAGVREVGAGPKAQTQAAGTAAVEGEAAPLEVSRLPPEAQARVKAAQAIAEKLLSGAPQQQQKQLPQAVPAAMPWQQQQQQQPVAPSAAINPMLAAAQAAAHRLAGGMAPPPPRLAGAAPGMPFAAGGGMPPNIAAAAAAALQAMGMTPATAMAAAAAAPGAVAAAAAPQPAKHYEAELEINDFPQNARWKVTHRETIREIGEQLGAAVVVKGRFFKPGDRVPEGERKLYLYIAANNADIVRRAKAEMKRLVEESTEKAMRREGPAVGRYSVM